MAFFHPAVTQDVQHGDRNARNQQIDDEHKLVIGRSMRPKA